ncbi:MAG: hypothetical protein F4Y74_07870 [Gemmatimonadales bacterium]|nr:hypothetical protein [Gemmatimonadales bacterium]MYG20034.1 hypothetical protein [Gemmatimonadales bacterium]MYH09188.1 hypothetical protein [Gemmatimonadales bacterium]
MLGSALLRRRLGHRLLFARTNFRLKRSLAATMVVVVSGCGSPADSPQEPVLSWDLTPEIRLGAQSGPSALYRVSARSTTMGPDGSFYVLDKGNHRVVTFSPEGDFVGAFGSKGDGRSELAYPMALLGPRGDTLWVLDGPSRSYKLFTTNGRFLETRRVRGSAASEDQRYIADGIVLVEILGYRDDSAEVTDRLVLIRGVGDTVTLSSHTRTAPGTYVIPVCNYIVPAEPLFRHILWWDAAGDMIAATYGAEYSVQLFRGGRFTGNLERAIAPAAISEALAREEVGDGSTWSIAGRGCTADPEEELAARGFEGFRQVIRGVRVDPAGWIWVRRHAALPGEDNRYRIDVFDSAGTFHGTLPPDTPWPGMFTPDGRVVRRELDGLDIEYLVVYRIDRN